MNAITRGMVNSRSLNTTDKRIHRHTNWNQECRCDNVHPRDGSDDSGSTEEHVGTGEDVVDEAEDHEDGVGDFSYETLN